MTNRWDSVQRKLDTSPERATNLVIAALLVGVILLSLTSVVVAVVALSS